MAEEEHPCYGCALFIYYADGITRCRAGLPRMRKDGKCFVRKDDGRIDDDENRT